jgi:hypothetical protein
MKRFRPLALLTALIAGQSAYAAPNNLLILADDMGVEALSVYGVGETTTPSTATIDSLAENGVLFRNFWSQPVCSPTRATIMTGRYGFRTGVGRPIAPHVDGGGSGPLPPPPAKPSEAPWEPPGMGRNPGNAVSPRAPDIGIHAANGIKHRADVFSGSFLGVEDANYAIRNGRYKLIRRDGVIEFYDLLSDPYEHANLFNPNPIGLVSPSGGIDPHEREQLDRLQDQVDALRASAGLPASN